MTAVTTGGITRKVLTGRSAAGLIRYEAVHEGKEAPLFSASRHCSAEIPTQIAEWKATRERHGTDGAKRAEKGRYETVNPETGLHASGRMGTHVKSWDGTRYRKRPVRAGETPTHLYVEPHALMVKESEAVHTIYAAGADLVNPDSIEDCARLFLAVKAEREELYPGLQEKLWLERNGESGLVHVHVASNATIYRDFTLDGVNYQAGQKMAGALTSKDDVRARSDNFLDDHPEFGFGQSLARVGTQAYADAQLRDGQTSYWEAKRGAESNQDRIRHMVDVALNADAVHDHDDYVAKLDEIGVEATEVGLRRGKPTKNHDYRYRLTGTKQAVRGKTLGVEYTHNAISTQLDLKAVGQEIQSLQGEQQTGPARPLPFEQTPWSEETRREYEKLVRDVEEMARDEGKKQAAELVETATPSPRQLEMQRRLDEMKARQAAKLERLQEQVDESWREAKQGSKQRQEALAADRAEREQKQQQILDNPPARFAGLTEDELSREVDEKVIVREEIVGRQFMRTDDLAAMRERHDLSYDEAEYLATKWWSLDRPATAQEEGREVGTPQSQPVTDAAKPETPERATEAEPQEQDSALETVEPEAQTSSAAPALDEPAGSFASAPEPAIETPVVEDEPGAVQEPMPQPAIEAEPQPWRSGLREVPTPKSQRIAQVIEDVARFEEEHARPVLSSGGRIDEAQVPAGVGPRFLAAYGDSLDPAVREQLVARVAKKQERSSWYEDASEARRQRELITKPVTERQRVRELDRRTAKGDWMAERIQSEIDAGDYRPVPQETREEAYRKHRLESSKAEVSARAADLEGTDPEPDDPTPGSA